MSATNDAVVTTSLWKRVRKAVAGVSAAALVGGLIVVGGFGAQSALASGPAPTVSVAEPESYIWGEDLPLDITVTGTEGAGAQYNVSVGVVIPANTHVQATGTLGSPVTYEAGDVLPGQIVNTPSETCANLGLADTSPKGASCRVPAGSQYLVFENIHDLPEGASASHTLTLRPDAGDFQIGHDFPYVVNVYTNGTERFLPVFPGSTGVNNKDAREKSSNAGQAANEVLVNALRVTKEEITHPENEVLRGVHGDRGAIYELRIAHTGQADLSNAVVVDYLPAGLEYLGSCGLKDSTTNANGTQGVKDEYPGSGPLNTATVGVNCMEESSIETVQGSLDDEGRFTQSDSGEVFTAVTWNVGEWLMTGPGGAVQVYPATEGTPAETVIRYRAGVPLYENTMDFGETVPSAESLKQGANLDNNRGSSTRHGTANPDARSDSDGAGAIAYTNGVVASGTYNDVTVSDSTTETIDAVDVRIVKTVNGGAPGAVGVFQQGGIARYSLALATSEYVSAVQGDPSERPLRIVDDMANGTCPIFGLDTEIWTEGGSEAKKPKFVLGTYNPIPAGPPIIDNPDATTEQWNDALAAANVDAVCQWDESTASTKDAAGGDSLAGGRLVSIAFSPAEGNFYLELALEGKDALNGPDLAVQIDYSIHQNSTYIKGSKGPEGGATTSRDIFENEAEINLRTTPIAAVIGIGTPGMSEAEQARLDAPWNAWDDSHAFLQAGTTELEKKVLERGSLPDRQDVWKEESDGGPAAERWVDVASTPFAAGDKTWYRLVIDPPNGADVRNPVLTDFLPEGVSFDAESINETTGRYEDMFVVPSGWEAGLPTLGSGACADPNWTPEPGTTLNPSVIPGWLNVFVPNDGIKLSGNVLTFDLGATGQKCGISNGTTTDRFLPFENDLEIYLLVTITDPSAFSEVDLPQNLAKYQQANDEGEIWFLRDDAKIEVDRTPRLLKGVAEVQVNDDSVSSTRKAASQGAADGAEFNSNRDGIEVVQGEKVTYRLDVTAPYTDSTNYLVWDVLPKGIAASDVAELRTAKLVSGGVEGGDVAFTANAYDYPYTSAPASVSDQLKDEYLGDERSIIVWNVTGSVPGSSKAVPAVTDDEGTILDPEMKAVERGFTLGYTVTVPATGADAAQISQSYDNDASIVEFSSENNGGGTAPVIIDGSENVATPRVPTDAEPGYLFEDTDNDASDASNVFIPDATMVKTLFSTEIGTNEAAGEQNLDQGNSSAQIVQGELVTFDYEVTVPAHTAVANGVLADFSEWAVFNPPSTKVKDVSYEFVSVDYLHNGTSFDPGEGAYAGFTANDDDNYLDRSVHGSLRFPALYEAGAADQTFTARITMWLDESLNDGQLLENEAAFAYDNPNFEAGGSEPKQNVLKDTAKVEYIDPAISITKSHDQGDRPVAIGTEVTYTIVASNTLGRPLSYENVVVDTVPAGLLVDTRSLKDAGATFAPNEAALTNGEGGTITWGFEKFDSLDTLPPAATFTYTATVSQSAGAGLSYTNEVDITGQTLPASLENTYDPEAPVASVRRGEREDDAKATVTAIEGSIEKGVALAPEPGEADFANTVSAPIGDTVRYEVVATLEPNINYYNVQIKDAFSGSSIGDPTRTLVSGPTVDPVNSIDGTWSSVTSGGTTTWTVSDEGSPHIPSSVEKRTITLVYDVDLTTAMTSNLLDNTATLSWTETSSETSPRHDDTSEAEVQILNPSLTLNKSVRTEGAPAGDGSFKSAESGEVNQNFEYRLRIVSAAGANRSDAYNTTVTDTVPSGVEVDEGSFRVGGQPVDSPNTVSKSGDTITWFIADGIEPGAQLDLTYEAKFAGSESLTAAALPNTARVTSYESFPEGGREYGPSGDSTANITPKFPDVTLQKSVTNPAGTQGGTGYGIAYAGENFSWTLQVNNSATAGVANDISVIDTLPKNWEYVGNAQISLDAGLTWNDFGDAAATDSDGKVQLTWGADLIRDAEASPLGAGDSFLVKFDAKPTVEALTDPGTGGVRENVRVSPHTNTLSATVTDLQGNENNGTEKPYLGPDSTADAFMNAADLEVTKSDDLTLTAGESGLGWTILVQNNGPDTAVGPITVSDITQVLPEGVTVTSVSGTGWECGALTTTEGAVSFDCELEGNLAAGDVTDPINVYVAVAADVAEGTTVTNTATVEGKTHDPKPENNEDPGKFTVETVADLEVVKTLGTNSIGVLNAGDDISWNLAIRNIGPSDSVSADGNQIVVRDTVPANVTNVTVTPATLPDGWSLQQDGNELVFTLAAGKRMTPSDPPIVFTVNGKISASAEAGTVIVNGAVIEPGPTTDPVDPNNESEVPTTPITSSSTIAAAKTRGTLVDGVWTPTTDGVTAGEAVSYLLTVKNTGTADIRGAAITDELPGYLHFGDWTPYPSSETAWTGGHSATGPTAGGTAAFELDRNLAPGEEASVIINLTIDEEHREDVLNTMCVSATNNTAVGSVLCAQDSTGSAKLVDWEIVKSHVDPDPSTTEIEPSAAGDSVRYVLSVYNNGPSASDGSITISDMLPPGFSYEGNDTVKVHGTAVTPVAVNSGIDPSTNRATVAWVLPAGTINVAPSAADVPAVVVEFDALIDEAATPGTYTNNAGVAGKLCPTDPVDPNCAPEPDPVPENNKTTHPVEVVTTSVFEIEKKVWDQASGSWQDQARVEAGVEARYQIVVTNEGPSANHVTLSDVLPSNVTFTGYVSDGNVWSCDTDAAGAPTGDCEYTGNAGKHPVGESVIVFDALVAPAASPDAADSYPHVNTATIRWSNTGDTTPNEDSDTAAIGFDRAADLALKKYVLESQEGDSWTDAQDSTTAGSVVAGESTSFRLLVSNEGPSNAVAPLVVVDTLPEGAEFGSIVGEGDWSASYDKSTRVITFTNAQNGLAAGAEALEIRYTALFDSGIAENALLENTAVIGSETLTVNGDENPANNLDPAIVEVHRQIDLGIVKSHDAELVRIGDELPFSIEVTNHGPSLASGIVVTDEVPFGLEVVSGIGPVLDQNGDPSGWTIDSITLAEPGDSTVDPVIPANPAGGATVVASYAGTLAPNEAAVPLEINTLVTAAAYDTVTNVVTVVANEPEPDPDTENPNHFEDPVVIPPQVTLVVEKTAVGEFKVGKHGSYSIEVSNFGPTADPGPITVTDVLPDGLSYVSSPELPAGVTVAVSGKTVIWTIEHGLAVDEQLALQLEVHVAQAAYPEVTNTVVIETPSELTPESITSDDVTVKVKPADPLAVTGGDLAMGLLAAGALLLLIGGAAYAMSRRTSGSARQSA